MEDVGLDAKPSNPGGDIVEGDKKDQKMSAARNEQSSFKVGVSFPETGGTTGNLIVVSSEKLENRMK
eukprot:10197185-Ditylum_brightwellii.AAC.1